jgi:hypothetical protein
MRKYEGTEILITKDGVTEKYIVTWSKADHYYLQHEFKPNTEWGIYGDNFNEILNLLDADKSEGYCEDFQIVTN